MQRTKHLLFILFTVFLLSVSGLSSKTNFSVLGGITLPSNSLKNIFDSNQIPTQDTVTTILNINYPDIGTGYSISAKLSLNLSENAVFWGGFSLIRFAKQENRLNKPSDNSDKGFIESITTIYPLNAGINYYLYDGSFSLYGIGNLSYNFINRAFNTDHSKISLGIPVNSSDNRLGYGIGAGFEYPLRNVSLLIEGTYNQINYIGANSGEESKSLMNVQIGVKF
ncbi:hypothetical protein MASR1M45_02300 [Candidatus Kapaibacterium sp.]